MLFVVKGLYRQASDYINNTTVVWWRSIVFALLLLVFGPSAIFLYFPPCNFMEI